MLWFGSNHTNWKSFYLSIQYSSIFILSVLSHQNILLSANKWAILSVITIFEEPSQKLWAEIKGWAKLILYFE